MFKGLLGGVSKQRTQNNQTKLYRDLIRHESKIGGEVFGPIAEGRRREFFCLDRNTWVWHEEWQDFEGNSHIQTTRYDVRPSGIIKSQNGLRQAVSPSEALRLRDAVRSYYRRVSREIYRATI